MDDSEQVSAGHHSFHLTRLVTDLQEDLDLIRNSLAETF